MYCISVCHLHDAYCIVYENVFHLQHICDIIGITDSPTFALLRRARAGGPARVGDGAGADSCAKLYICEGPRERRGMMKSLFNFEDL